MGIASLFLFLALLVLVALFVARPLLQSGSATEDALDEKASWLEAEYERVLDALAELDTDWELGKVPEDIYRPQREQLVVKGAAALRALEKAGVITEKEMTHAANELSDTKLEAMIAARKIKSAKQKK